MFKLVVLFALVAVAASAPAPGFLAAAPAVAYTSVVGHAPATISHTSSSVVHSAAFAAPVVHAAPVLSYAAPAVVAAPAHFAAYSVHPAPAYHSIW